MVVLMASRTCKSQPRCQDEADERTLVLSLAKRKAAGIPHGEPPVARLNLRVL
jgi:hypothetical protein